MSLKKIVGVHSGRFHADDVCVVAMLKIPYKVKIVRSRDSKELSKCDIVADVGLVYDPSADKFDHHQPDCKDCFEPGNKHSTIKMAASGMVYKKYGKEIIKIAFAKMKIDVTDAKILLPICFRKLYYSFIQEIDALDNGTRQYKEGRPVYYITNNATSLIGGMNYKTPHDDKKQMIQFKKAVDLLSTMFKTKMRSCIVDNLAELHERIYVKQRYANREQKKPFNGRVLQVDRPLRYWKKYIHLYPCKWMIYPAGPNKWKLKSKDQNFAGEYPFLLTMLNEHN
jgi:uncharacterized UPF0160 family protein